MMFKIYLQYLYLLIIQIILIPSLFATSIKINGIAAIVGDQIISDFDIKEFINHSKNNKNLKKKQCNILENILLKKILIFYGKHDKSIKINKNKLKNQVKKYINLYLENIYSEKELLHILNITSINELHTELFKKLENQYFFEQKKKQIIENIDIGPIAIKKFFQKNKSNLPIINEKSCLAHIILYPKISQKSKNKLIKKLKIIKKNIESGYTTFSEQAKIYSDDKKSALRGGFYKHIQRKNIPHPFDYVIFKLKEKQISHPFFTKLGCHIIKLEKNKGKLIDFRHILLHAIPNQKEINIAQTKLESIKNIIETKKISFKTAALKFSDDKLTYLNSGLLYDKDSNNTHIEKYKLSTKEIFYLSSLKNNEISSVFEDEINHKKVLRILQLIKNYPEHKLNLYQNYNKIKQIAIIQKMKNKLKKWIIHKIPKTFIYIDNQFQNCNFKINWNQ